MRKFKNLFFHSPKKYIISLLIGLIITLCFLFQSNFVYLRNYVDGLFIGGATIFSVGALSLVSYFGAFDLFSYNIKRFSKDGRDKYKSLYDYTVIMKEERKNLDYPFIPYFVVGTILLIISVILFMFI